jgi:hypothetical protein
VEIVARMMAKDPARRYQNPTEVLADLGRWEAGQEPSPASRPPPDRSGKRRGLVLAALGLATALAIVLWLSLRQGAGPAVTIPPSSPMVNRAEPDGSASPVATPEKPARPRRTIRSGAPLRNVPPRGRSGDPVMDALASRDSDKLRALLDRGAPPNVTTGGLTPLHYAVLLGDGRTVRLLLEKGANPNAQDSAGETPLILAIRRGDRPTGAALLDFGANPNARDRAGWTPLQLVAGDDFWTRKLLEKGAH